MVGMIVGRVFEWFPVNWSGLLPCRTDCLVICDKGKREDFLFSRELFVVYVETQQGLF